ncbi:MAG: hypothetical protein LBN18_07975 [Dysgonamonadaceae bacterium]|nr:hypothetical protein [Dysgonamonadaceae bacterium]
MKLAAVVVLYHPDDQLLRNIRSYIGGVDLLMLWENSPLADKEKIQNELAEYSGKIVFLGNGQNAGLGKAYNEAARYAKSAGYTHLMTMDQDSCFVQFEGFRENIEKETDPKVKMQAPFFNQDKIYDEPPFEVRLAINSGAVFPLDLFDETGFFREDFFIGGIDVEFNHRLRKFGYKCVRYSNCNMYHTVGSCRYITMGRLKFEVTDYSPARRFYCVKNEFALYREYPNEYSFRDRWKFFLYQVKDIVKILWKESNKKQKVNAILRGAWYGFRSIDKPYSS